ncbi:MAG: T9SS type A sorting domain-containing protein [Calditrichaeota bacterium]|nr:T9SS type A sorting domain-containing protein [Calditrichota bacterium]
MKKTVLLLLLFIVPSASFAVSNARMNGQKEITINRLPMELLFTCDLASPGNKLAFEYYLDLNGDGRIGPQEEVVEFYYITDGIGWIKDPDDPDNDFAGDETNVDGKIRTIFNITPDEVFLPEGISGMLKLTDEDGSTDFIKITIDVQAQPPFIQGQVTDAETGAPIARIFVFAEDAENTNYGITDDNGNYKIAVTPGTFKIAAMEMPMVNYQASDSVQVTVTGVQNQTVDLSLQPFKSFIQGKLTMEDGTPVPEIMIFATGGLGSPFYSMTSSDSLGNYRMGVMPGSVIVSPSRLINFANENWPAEYYVDPETDSLNLSEGQTVTSDFVFKPYKAFITGTCTVNGSGLAGVEITGMAMDLTTFVFRLYQTVSDENGNYKLGVMPGTITSLAAQKDGYNVVSPSFPYVQIPVQEGQTVTGKDFSLESFGTVTAISGRVTFSDGSTAPNVYVAAENNWEESPQGFLIAYTDNNGDYQFDDVMAGDYHLGVYKRGYSSDPAMRSFYLDEGTAFDGRDFVLTAGTGVAGREHSAKPRTIRLAQNFPNPFNPSTTIQFELPKASQVEITIFNTRGQKVRSLMSSFLSPGEHQVEWNGRDDAGNKVSSGVYFYTLKSGQVYKMMKMILAQ